MAPSPARTFDHTRKAKHPPESPAEVARFVSATTVCVVGGVWIGLRVVDSLCQLGHPVVLKGRPCTGAPILRCVGAMPQRLRYARLGS